MSHMVTATGQEYHFALFAPAALRPVCIEDIAHQLSLINRFHGATCRPYSVAEHSLLVCDLARDQGLPPIVQLACLLHDAHEIYTNDLSSPAKRALDQQGSGCSAPWAAFENEHAHHLRQHFGLLSTFAAYRHTIRHLDLVALATEREHLTAWNRIDNTGWACLKDGLPDAIQPGPKAWANPDVVDTWQDVRGYFLAKFQQLNAAVQATVLAMNELALHAPAGANGETP